MFNKLARGELLIRCQFIGGSCQVLNHSLLLDTQICMAKLRSYFFPLNLIQASIDRDTRNPVLQRHRARKLREFLKYFDENHLAKVLFVCSARAMAANDPCDQRIELSHQCTRRIIVLLERSVNKRIGVSIIHVVESASTPGIMTAGGAFWLQFGWRCPRAKQPASESVYRKYSLKEKLQPSKLPDGHCLKKRKNFAHGK